jgi:hypothetical protein
MDPPTLRVYIITSQTQSALIDGMPGEDKQGFKPCQTAKNLASPAIAE